MIPIETAAAQAARLGDLREFPADPILQLDLVEALRHCDSERHAKEVINEWKYANTFAPKPADLHRLVQSTAKLKPSCGHCHGHGFVFSHERDGYSFTKPCPACRKQPAAEAQKAGHA